MKSTIFFLLVCFIISCSTEPKFNSGWTLQRDQKDQLTFYSIHFFNENKGWIAGLSGTIESTSNGGDSWMPQQSGVQSNLWDICFVNDRIGWVCGADNTILKTIDAGKTWDKITPSEPSDKLNVAIKFIDEQNGWLSNNHGEILKSSDGGFVWQVVKQNNIGGAHLAVFDENTVYFLNGKLFRTFDGGETWDSLNVSTPTNYMSSEMFFSDPQTGYITTVNGTGGTIINEYPILMTKNGGINWQASDYLEGNGFVCVYFIDKDNGWIGGSNVYKTSNGGENWILDYSPNFGPLHIKEIFFITQDCGWLTNWGGQIYKYENK